MPYRYRISLEPYLNIPKFEAVPEICSALEGLFNMELRLLDQWKPNIHVLQGTASCLLSLLVAVSIPSFFDSLQFPS